jgi:tripartite-type tricarboxylate transporter receptor subunit TctC
MRLRRRHLLAALALPPRPAAAQGFPTQPVRLIVPFAAGGAVDFVGRLVGMEMATRLGQSVVVENRTGAAGAIGAQYVARATPDGHTLMMTPLTSFAMLAGLPGNNLALDMARDFAAIGTIGAVPLVVVVNPRLPVNTLAELVAHIRARPGAIGYASSGNGSTEHLAGELFAGMTGTQMLHVPYRGGAPALADVIAGQVPLMFATAPNVLQNGGTLKVLAIATAARSAALPLVPTTAEAGLPGFEVSSVYGILAPAGTPAPVIERLNRELLAAVATPAVRDRLLQQGVDAAPSSPQAATALLAAELARWAGVIRAAGVTLQ